MATKQCMIVNIANDTYAINEYGLSAMFLLIGRDKAMLIDTGCGICDIKEIVGRLTDKPLMTVLTHAHGDHVGGAFRFDEIYLHKADEGMLRNTDNEGMKRYVEGFVDNPFDYGTGEKYPDVYSVRGTDVAEFTKVPETLHYIEDGDVIDLGDRPVEVIGTPGHTPGSISFLDRKTRVLFSGDACNVNLLLPWGNVSDALGGLYKLRDHKDEFDRNYNGHIGYAMMLSCAPMPERVLTDCIYICEGLVAGTLEGSMSETPYGRSAIITFGSVRITYDPDNVQGR